MNMSTKEIAEIMNISNGGVELARYRLRKIRIEQKRKPNRFPDENLTPNKKRNLMLRFLFTSNLVFFPRPYLLNL